MGSNDLLFRFQESGSDRVADGAEEIRSALKETGAAAEQISEEQQARLREEEQLLEVARAQWGQVGQAIERVAEVARSASRQTGEAIEATNREVKNLSKEAERAAKALKDTRRAVEALEESIEKTRQGGGVVSESEIAKLQTLRTELAKLEAERADTKIKAAFEGMKESVRGASTAVFNARRAVEALEESIAKTRRSGGVVSESEVAKLRTLRAELAKLEDQYAKLQDERADFVTDSKARAAATAGEIGPINDLQDILALGGSRWADWGARAFAAFGALKLGLAIGSEARGVLNGLFDALGLGAKGFDEALQSALQMDRVTNLLVRSFSGAASEAEVLTLQIRTLDAAGIKHAGTVEDITRKYDAFIERQKASFLAARNQEGAYQAVRNSLLGLAPPEEVKKKVDDLVAAFQNFERTGSTIDAVEKQIPGFTAAVDQSARALDLLLTASGKVVRGPLNDLRRVLVELQDGANPEELRRLAAATADFEAAAASASGEVDAGLLRKMAAVAIEAKKLQQGKGSIDTLNALLQDLADASNAAAGSLDDGTYAALLRSGQALDLVRNKLQASAGDFSALGIASAQGIRDTAAQIDRFIAGVGGLGALTEQQAKQVESAIEGIYNAVRQLPSEQQALLAGDLEGLKPLLEAVRDRAAGLAVSVDGASSSLGRFAESTDGLSGNLVSLGDDLARLGIITGPVGDQLQGAVESLSAYIRELGGVGAVSGAQADQVRERIALLVGVIRDLGPAAQDVAAPQLAELERLMAAIDGRTSGAAESAGYLQRSMDGLRITMEDVQAGQGGIIESSDQLIVLTYAQAEATEVLGEAMRKRFGLESPEAIKRSSEQLGVFADAMGSAATVSSNAAERIVADAKKQLEAIAALPPEEQKLLATEKAINEERIRVYARATTEIKAQMKEVATAVGEELGKVLSDLQARAAEVQKSVQSGNAAAAEELAALRSKQEQQGGLLSDEDFQRLNQLETSADAAAAAISDLERSGGVLDRTNSQVAASSGEVADALNSILDAVEANRPAFDALGVGLREQFLNNLSQMKSIGDQGGATLEYLQAEANGLAQILEQGGFSGKELRDALASAAGTSDSLQKRINALSTELGGLNDGVDPMAKKFEDLVKAAEGIEKRTVPTMKALREESKGVVAELGRAVELAQRLGLGAGVAA